MEDLLKAYSSHFERGEGRALLSGGVVFTWLATGKETGGRFSLFEAKGIPGMEPPPHMHTREDESFYLLEGELLFKIGDKQILSGPGDFIFMPRGVRHEFKVLSPSFHCLASIFPAGIENYFAPLSKPHLSSEIPPVNNIPPTPEAVAFMKELDMKFGITYYTD